MFVFPPSPPPSGSGSSGSLIQEHPSTSAAAASMATMVPMSLPPLSQPFDPSLSVAHMPTTSAGGGAAAAALLHHRMHMHMPMLTTTPPPTLSIPHHSPPSSSSAASGPFPRHHPQQPFFHQPQSQQRFMAAQSSACSSASVSPPTVSPHQPPSQFSNISNSNNGSNAMVSMHMPNPQQPLAAAPVVPLPADLVRTVDPAGLGPSSVMPTATYVGYVEELADALYIFEGTQAGLLPRTTRRLTAAEKDRAVYHGAIHVFLERESGIKRWTDKLHWSASRIAGHFLMYREIEPATAAAKQAAAAASTPGSANKVRTPTTSSSASATAGPTPPRSPAVTSGNAPSADNNDEASATDLVTEKPACPMARKSGYAIKSTGLIKRTVSLVYRGITHHLVSYFDESRIAQLPRPRLDPRLNHLPICSEVKPLLKKAQGSAGQAAAAANASGTTTAVTVNGGDQHTPSPQQLAAHGKRSVDDAEGVGPSGANTGATYALEVSHKRSRKTRTSPSTSNAAAALSAIASQVSTPPHSPAQDPPAAESSDATGDCPPAPPPPPASAAIPMPMHTSVFAPMPRSASSLSNGGPQLVMDTPSHPQLTNSSPCNSPPTFDTSLPTSPTSPSWPSGFAGMAPRPSSMLAAAASASATPRSGLSEWAPAAPAMPNEGPPPDSESADWPMHDSASPVVGPGMYAGPASAPQQQQATYPHLDLWSPAAHSPALSFEDHPPTAAQPAWVFAALPPMLPNETVAAGWGPDYGNANVAAAVAANQFWASNAAHAAAAAANAANVFVAPPPPALPVLSPHTFAQVLASPDPAADGFMYLPAAAQLHGLPPHMMAAMAAGVAPMDSMAGSASGAHSVGTPAASPLPSDASPLLSMQLDSMGIESPVMHGGDMGSMMFPMGGAASAVMVPPTTTSAVMDLFATATPANTPATSTPVQHGIGPHEYDTVASASTLSGLFSPVLGPAQGSAPAQPTPSEFDVSAWLANVASGTDDEDAGGKDKEHSGPVKEQRRD